MPTIKLSDIVKGGKLKPRPANFKRTKAYKQHVAEVRRQLEQSQVNRKNTYCKLRFNF